MGISCPNKNLQEWKDLVEEVGEQKAYEQYVENDFDIPQKWRRTNEPALNEAINKFLQSTGVTVSQVREITNRDGEVIGANAMADLIHKTIQVVEGKTEIDTLPEEASHFLVAMLRDSVLYKSMYNDVQNYDIYKDVVREYSTQYNGNETKLKEEAMAKIIGSIVVDNFTDPKLEVRANQWWNRVLQYIKSIFAKGNTSDLNMAILDNAPFSEAADMIINDSINQEYYPSREDDDFYQLSREQSQEEVVKAIESNLNRGSISLKGDNYVLTRKDGTEIPIKRRVSDRVKEAMNKFGFKEFTPQQIESNLVRSTFGTKGHADLENIIGRAIALNDNKILEGRSELLGKEMYKTLESYVRNFMDSFPVGTRFISESKVYDERADEAGTIDLIAVYPDGKTDIYDWKFQEFKGAKDNKQIAGYKKRAWNIQLGRYAEMLKKTYGIQNVNRKRVIPIETVYENNKLKSIKVGATQIENFGKKNQHLKPVPIISEMTGDERFDRLLEDLIRQKEDLESQKPSNITDDAKRAAFAEQKKIKLQEIEKSIQDIQLTNDIESYVKRGIKQVKDIQDTGVENLSPDELNDAYHNMQFYGQRLLSILGNLVKDKTKAYQSDLKDLVANAQVFQNELTNEFIRRSKNQFGDNIDMPQTGSNFWTRTMRTLSQQNHPVMKAFYNLVQSSKKKTREALNELSNNVEHTIEALEKYQKGKGIDNTDMFDFMLDKSGKNLRLLAKYSPEFYTQRDTQRELLKNGTKEEQSKALAWMRENTIFDEEKYNKAYEENKKQSKRYFRNYENSADVIKRASQEFENKYGNNSNGYKNASNFYIRPKDDFFSDKYKYIQENEPLKNFYDLFTKNTEMYRKIIGQPYDARFVWNVKKDFIDSVAENGLGATNPLSFLTDGFTLQPGMKDGNVDPQTGEPIHSLPTYYLNGVEAGKQSRDLGRVLYMAGAMAYNYKHMSEIEDSAKGLEIILRSSEEVMTNNNGDPIVNKVTGRLQKIIGSSDTIDQYKDYMNYYVYGVKNKTKDFKIKVGNTDISALAAYQFVNKMFIGKSLAANPVSIIANSVGGDWNVRILGAGKRFFNNAQYNSSLASMATRDRKAYSIIGFLDLLDGENHYAKATELSVSSLTKHITYENMFIGQKAGDYAIRNGVGLAMLKNHELVDGKVVKITDGKKGATSLYDMFSIEDGKLKGMESIPDAEIEKIRTKILKVSEDILGNNSRDDIRTASLTVMGRALMAFRSWIPRTIDSRYGELRYSEDIQDYELGRYRSFWNQIVSKQWAPLLKETAANLGTFGYSDFGNATRDRARELYREAIIKDPSITMTEEQFIDMHIANLKANMMEIYIVTSMLALLMAVRPGDDDDKDDPLFAVRKVVTKQMARNMSELLFYYNPAEFNKILKSPIPITRAFGDLYSLFYDTGKEGWGAATGNEKMQYEARPLKYGLKVFPVLNGLEAMASMIDEDYDRDSNFSGNSSHR